MANTDGLKFIKFMGVIQNLASSASQEGGLVIVEGAKLKDQENETFEPQSLLVETNLWDPMLKALKANQPVTLYMARLRRDGRLVAMVYAMETQGRKLYYPKAALDCLWGFALLARTRGQLVRNPFLGAVLGLVGTLVLFIVLASVFGDGSAVGIAAATLGAGYYAWWFATPLLRRRKYSNIDALEAQLKEAGFPFSEVPAPSAKY